MLCLTIFNVCSSTFFVCEIKIDLLIDLRFIPSLNFCLPVTVLGTGDTEIKT